VYVAIETGQSEPAAITLREQDDLKRFSVRVSAGLSRDLLASVLRSAAVGRLDGDEASISVAWLRERTTSQSPQWQTDFEKMLDYAASKGWTDPARTAVTAHIEYGASQRGDE
jgi:hypothetical protein